MSYKKWNNALIKYYFNNNSEEEVILYCDEEIINEIGSKNKIGSISDFVNCVLTDEKGRTSIFDSYFHHRNGNITLNRKIKVNSDLKFSIVLYETGIEKKISLTFFSYIIISILKNTLIADNDNYTKFQVLSNPAGYDNLFYSIEEKYPRFINRKIGKHRYEGLIKFQIVLTKNENIELEKILYKNQFEFSEYESYESILNRIIRHCDGKLRDKLQLSATDECYKIWFENKLKNFKLENYKSNHSTRDIISVVGEFVLAFNMTNNFQGLQLLTNVNPKEVLANNGITIYPSEINSKLENGFFPNSVKLENEEPVKLKEYNFIGEGITIKSLSIKDIILLQKINNHLYIQTEHPCPNTETFILVKNNPKAITEFQKWCFKKELTSSEIPLEKSQIHFGSDYNLFICNNLTEPYYKPEKNTFFELNNDINKIKKIGGFKPKGTVNTYLDVALPQFQLNILNFQEHLFKISYLRKDRNNDKVCFEHTINVDTVTIFFKDTDLQSDNINIQINFEYNNIEIGSFDFLIESSKMKPIDKEASFVKLDKWGHETNFEPYYNVLSIEGADKIGINGNRHKIDFQENYREHSDYFIYLLNAAFYKSDKNYIEKHKLKEIYHQSLRFLNSQKTIDLMDTNYSFNNLLKYLVDLGFLQRKIIPTSSIPKECYLLVPPTFTKIEKSFTDGGSQIYLLTGIYSRKFTFLVKNIAETNNIKINYRTLNSNLEILPETFLLPDLMLIENKFPFDELKQKCKENGLDFLKEDNYNYANSLLNFSASIIEFEKKFEKLRGPLIETNTQNSIESDLKPSDENFPRLRVIVIKEIYKAKTYFIEIAKNKFYKYDQPFSSKWLNLYVKNKRKDPIIIYRKKRSDTVCFNYDSSIYLYKYDQFPTLVTKSLTLFNVGLPSEEKIFIIDSAFNNYSKNFAFNNFLKYNISSDPERRKKLAKILTGSELIEGNDQIVDSIYFDNYPIKMELYSINSFSFDKINKFILIKRDNQIISIITVGNYSKPQSIYLASELLQNVKTSEINIDGTTYNMIKIEMTEDCNAIISAIIKNDTEKIKNYKATIHTNKNFTIHTEDYTTENILIIDNY